MEATLQLRRAVLLYEDEGMGLATVNDVSLDAHKRPLIGPGRCLSRSVLDEMIRKMSGIQERREILPANVLIADGSRMAWHIPSGRHPIFFHTKDHGLNRAMSGRSALHPALLFLAEPKRLFIYALAQDERPEADTPIYRAPYFNTYTEGNMCAGNIALPESVSVSDIPRWEAALFETNFTHNSLAEGKLTLHPQKHAGLWWYLVQPRVTTFPVKYLAPFGGKVQTVGEAINQ